MKRDYPSLKMDRVHKRVKGWADLVEYWSGPRKVSGMQPAEFIAARLAYAERELTQAIVARTQALARSCTSAGRISCVFILVGGSLSSFGWTRTPYTS